MKARTITVKSTSFEINKLITASQLFSNVKLTASSRLVLRCIVDFWNFKVNCAYPTQATIAKCTGLTEVAVGNAVKELSSSGLIDKIKHHKRFYYYFTPKFLGYLKLTPKISYIDTQKSFGNIPINFLGKNILKYNENTSFSSSFLQEEENIEETPEERGLIYAKTMIKHLSDKPAFAKKVAQLKEKYGL